MRKMLFVLLLAGVAQSAFAQQSSLKGRVVDTLEKKGLQNAVVTLLRPSDSTLFNFSRTGKTGEFNIPSITPGTYIMLVTYPNFADFAENVEVKQEETDFGVVPLTLKSRLLDAVIVKSTAAVRIKGDTTEFIADSFKVREGATVEELLRKLPGFQVNSKGEITTQGQKVQKVLVDGEEFFGDDPTMATQNLSARTVDKVQVYDTKTDQQNLTGISSGAEGKTVNIKLKEDSKKGAFGKGHVGSDFQKLVDAKLLYNKFVGKKKFSLYGTKSNLSTGSLNWEDKQKLGIENDFEFDEISGYYYSFGSNDEFNDWSLRGLPDSYSAGTLFSDKWNEEKHAINGSYRYNRLGTENESSTLTQNILQNSVTYRNKYQNTQGLNQQHTANGKYEWKPDSLSSFKFTTVLTWKKTDLYSDTYSEFLGNSQELINKSDQLLNNHTEKKQADNILNYKQLFTKKNRILMATLRFGYIEDDQTGVIKTDTRFYANGVQDSVDIADQQKNREGSSKTIGTKITWSEPLSAKSNLVFEYAYNKNISVSRRNTYNKDASGKYSTLDAEFSNNFDLDVFSHSGTAFYRYTGKKLRGTFGTGISTVKLDLAVLDSNRMITYRFLNYTPQASIAYSFAPQTRLSLNYRGTTRQPSIDQLQPIRDNTDRLNVFVGNPFLKVGFNHNINLGFNTYKTLSQKGMFASFSFNKPINAITYFNTLDITTGKQNYTPVNVNGNHNWNIWTDYFKDGQGKLGYGISFNGNGGKNINFTNAQRNATTYMNTNLSFSLRYFKEEKHSFDIGPKVGYNKSESSLNPDYNNNYWNYGGRADGMIMLPGKLELRSDVDFDLRGQIGPFGSDPNQIIWNANISKKVFKNKSGRVFVVANDILNQRIGLNRNISSNFVSEERYQRIARYFLLKFEWSFNKMPGQPKN